MAKSQNDCKTRKDVYIRNMIRHNQNIQVANERENKKSEKNYGKYATRSNDKWRDQKKL